jgi:hypothetical protein
MNDIETNINCFISSKTRKDNEKPSNVHYVIQPGLLFLKENDDYMRMSVLSFHIQNNFYNVNDFNNEFQILTFQQYIFGGNNFPVTEQTLNITNGNYSIHDFIQHINTLAIGHFELQYNHITNKFKLINTHPNDMVFLRCISSGLFFGVENGAEIPADGNELQYHQTMSSFDKICLNIRGVQIEKKSIENLTNMSNKFETKDILLWASRSDIPINAMIKYDNNDGGKNYSYYVHNREINEFSIQLTDENGNELKEALDYTLLLRFTIVKKNENMKKEIMNISNNIKSIYLFFMFLLEYLNII